MKSECNLLTVKSESWFDLTQFYRNKTGNETGNKWQQEGPSGRWNKLGPSSPSQAAQNGKISAAHSKTPFRFQRSLSATPVGVARHQAGWLEKSPASPKASAGDHLLIRLRQEAFLRSSRPASLATSCSAATSNDCLSRSVQLEGSLAGSQATLDASLPLADQQAEGLQLRRHSLAFRLFRDRLESRAARPARPAEVAPPAERQPSRRSWSALSERSRASGERLWLRGRQIVEKTWKSLLPSLASGGAKLEPKRSRKTASGAELAPPDSGQDFGPHSDRRRFIDDWVTRHCGRPAR